MRDKFQIWVDAVCEQVRFRPDRKGIEKELRVHYEDHVQDLLRLNYDPELAAERALSAMGNAQEVGRALDKVHKPWLGWLWEASRWLARALAVLALVTLFHTVGVEDLVRQIQGELNWEEPPASAERVELKHATLWAAPGEVTEQDGKTEAEVRLWIKMRDPLVGRDGVWAWYFSCRDEKGELPRWEYDHIARTGPESRYWTYYGAGGRGWTRFQKSIKLVLDEPPEWAEVSYPLSGQDWALRVEWEAET